MHITVVVCAYNEEKYIKQCLTALMQQSIAKSLYEVVLVDNNSSDKTLALARKFPVTIVHEAKQGYVFALKKGMSEAKGDIIAVTDADTIVAPDWLKTISKAFEDTTVIAVGGSGKLPPSIYERLRPLFDIYLAIAAFVGRPNLNGFNFAVRRQAYERVGGIDTNFTMSPDVELGLRLSLIGKVLFLPTMQVTTSDRRWKNGFWKAFFEYTKSYIYTTLLHKPPFVIQKAYR